MGDVQMTTKRLVAERIIEYVRSKNPDVPDSEFTVETVMESSEWGMLLVAIEASIEAAQFDNCACAWGYAQNPSQRWYAEVTLRQIAWCRLHMEAEIAKQGQAAGSPPLDSGNNVDGAQIGSVTQQRASQ